MGAAEKLSSVVGVGRWCSKCLTRWKDHEYMHCPALTITLYFVRACVYVMFVRARAGLFLLAKHASVCAVTNCWVTECTSFEIISLHTHTHTHTHTHIYIYNLSGVSSTRPIHIKLVSLSFTPKSVLTQTTPTA